MYDLYMVTGATGTLGSVLVKTLSKRGKKIRALVLPGDCQKEMLPEGVEIFYGYVEDKSSMESFFSGDLTSACLIHCAGMITIATCPSKALNRINIKGTKNVIDLSLKNQVPRMVYISSVHAIPENNRKGLIDEKDLFTEGRLKGSYAKSKFEATELVMKAALKGLQVNIVMPSGILSPFDPGKDNISAAILSYCKGKLTMAVKGGYDFVDVRDVVEGILACTEFGKAGENYILSGHYATLNDILGYIKTKVNGKRIFYLELWFVKILSPFLEMISIIQRKPRFMTPCSAHILGSNALYSRKKAEIELGYRPRSLYSTLNDILKCFY